MKIFKILLATNLFFVLSCNTPQKKVSLQFDQLLVDYMINPQGLDNPEPGFSWQLVSSGKAKYQSAYQVLIASDNKNINNNYGDIWDSGKIRSEQSAHVKFKGKPLKSGHRYFWKVKVWDEKDNPTSFSKPDWFEMGKLKKEDWQAQWIAQTPDSAGMPRLLPAPYFRKEFMVKNTVNRARLYISGLGYYKAYLNGEKIGDHEIDPSFTRYDRRVKYVLYDVTDLLQTEINCIGVVLGNGWYNQHTRSAWDLDSAIWREDPSLMAQLEISYADGSKETFTTDNTWKVGHGPVIFDGIRNGEHYDARKEIPGWNKPGFDDSRWNNAYAVVGPEGKLSAQVMPPIREIRTLGPVDITEPKENIFVIDFGENITGRLRLSIEGEDGQEIVMRYGERLKEDGTLDQKELARFIWTGETQTDHYICKGEGTESWESSFVYHGFQYVEIQGLKQSPSREDFQAVVLHTDLKPAGSFSCSNEMFNTLQNITLNSFLGNYHGYPTDCPHREKIGWSGDAQLVSAMGLYNFNMVPAYLKWIDDFADEQRPDGKVAAIIPTSGWGYTHGRGPNREFGYGPHWDGAYINIPWDMYMFTGDTCIIKRYYRGFKRYMDYLERSAIAYVLEYGIDDHKPVTTITDGDILSTAYFYDFALKMARMAGDIHLEEDNTYYLDLSKKIYRAFNDRFFNKESGIYGNGGQTSLSMALYLDLVPEAEKGRVLNNLIAEIKENDHYIDAGVIGTRFMLKATTKYGLEDLMYEIADQRDFPGWGNWVERGATTLWQTWEGDMSLNHIMFGSIGEWFYNTLAGIRYDPDEPGYQKIILRPEIPDKLNWVEADHQSLYGTISSHWKKEENAFSWDIAVPVNTTATVCLPVEAGPEVLENGEPVNNSPFIKIVDQNSDLWILEVGSGNYSFTVK